MFRLDLRTLFSIFPNISDRTGESEHKLIQIMMSHTAHMIPKEAESYVTCSMFYHADSFFLNLPNLTSQKKINCLSGK